MNAVQDLSFIELITNAHLIVQLIMACCSRVSLTSWTYIFRKLFAIRAARRQTEQFERSFWAGGNLHTLHQSASAQRDQSGRWPASSKPAWANSSRASRPYARRARHGRRAGRRPPRHARRLPARARRARPHLNFLASVGSVSPYIGLLGTVWGIMNAFRGLANVQQATLAAVAPGIAEALIATAIGLFAAIPAVVAYNRFTHDIDRLAIRFESFVEEFSNILQRQSR
jgi:biopolymer transport protein TolQ